MDDGVMVSSWGDGRSGCYKGGGRERVWDFGFGYGERDKAGTDVGL